MAESIRVSGLRRNEEAAKIRGKRKKDSIDLVLGKKLGVPRKVANCVAVSGGGEKLKQESLGLSGRRGLRHVWQ